MGNATSMILAPWFSVAKAQAGGNNRAEPEGAHRDERSEDSSEYIRIPSFVPAIWYAY